MMGGVINFVFIRTRYVRILKQYGRVPPEERLVPMMAGSIALPVGLFWFAWTSHPSSSPIPQIISGAPVGMGMDASSLPQQKKADIVNRHRAHLPPRDQLRKLIGALASRAPGC